MTRAFDALAYLDAHVNRETGVGVPAGSRRGAPTLERVAVLLKYLGSPEQAFPVIHVTGTNGKGSTVWMATQLLLRAGLKVGAYTSPHLERVNERISIDDEPIDDDALGEVLHAVSLVERSVDVAPSYFEALTAAAFRHFEEEAVDIAVVEVGLGGTWDATNVVDGRVAVVTNVSLDHTEYLGPTRESIAQEKAGIVKPGATLVLGETDPDLAPVFASRGAARVVRRAADFGVRENRVAVGGRFVELYTPRASYPDVLLPLHGAHQADNAAVALAAVEELLGDALGSHIVEDAFAHVRSPGRLEMVLRRPVVLLDGAHNVAGAQALRRALDEEFRTDARTFVVGLLREKDPREMLTAAGIDDASLLVCCRPPSPRARDPRDIADAAQQLGVADDRIEVVGDVPEGIAAALLGTPDDGQIVVTGSLYTVGAARSVLVKP